MSVDVAAMSDDDLGTLLTAVRAEQERRRIPAAIDSLITRSLAIEGVEPGQEWRQPTGAQDAYPKGWDVAKGGKVWESPIPANVWEPPTNWREVVPDGGAPAEWVQPSGAEDAYNTGDQVTFEGSVYESVIDANTWSPSAYPAGWKTV